MKEKKVELSGKEYTLKPLDWESYPKLFTLVSKFEGVSEENMSKVMDEATIKLLMDLELKTFKISHPEIKETELKQIVMTHMFELIEVIIDLNLNK